MSVKETLLNEAIITLERNLSSGLMTSDEIVMYLVGYCHSRGVPITIADGEIFVMSYINQLEEV